MVILKRAAHQLKGSADNFTLPPLNRTLTELCNAAEAGDRVAIDRLAAILPEIAAQARRSLHAGIGAQTTLTLNAQ
jgi:HPt (histidine-containing phosphotransfer) domain-containing protein